MYAIIQDGGHQYRVENGGRLRIQVRDNVEKGAAIVFDQVCMVGGGEGAAKVGAPYVKGATVEATVTTPMKRDRKVIVFKYRRRKNSQRRRGHRQNYTEVQITAIKA
jgi:large subunit ribosomal protein L21